MPHKEKSLREVAKAPLAELVKTVREDVIIDGVHFRLHAQSLNVRFDDPVYAANREAWEHVTRGGCNVFEVTASSGAAPSGASGSDEDSALAKDGLVKVGSMCGLRKFGYVEDKAYGYYTKLHSIVALEKENGENAQVSAFVHNGVRYWLIGSKNVPLLVRHNHFVEDMSAAVYSKERYGFARKIADLFWRCVLAPRLYTPIGDSAADDTTAMPAVPASARSILEFHEALSSNGWTAVGEAIFLDSQHIVSYDRDTMRFFALAQPGKPSEAGLTALPPLEALEFFKSFGLEVPRVLGTAPVWADEAAGVAASTEGPPPNTTGSTNEPEAASAAANPLPSHARQYSAAYTDLCKRIGELDNSEGAVAYGIGGDGKQVVFVYKVKSYLYIIGRRARQIILGRLPDSALAGRLLELTKLGVPEPLVRSLLPYYLSFAKWLRAQRAYTEVFGAPGDAAAAAAAGGKGAPSTGKGAWGIQQQWVTLHKTFAAETKQGGKTTAEDGGAAASADAAIAEATAGGVGPGEKVVIMLQGLPLTGKSTLARQLLVLLRRAGHTPRWLNQDEVGDAKNTNKRAGFLRQLEACMADPKVTHVIVDKSNVIKGNVDDYLDRGVVPTVTIRMRHPHDKPGSLDKLIALCKQRFYERGAGHRTLKAAPSAPKPAKAAAEEAAASASPAKASAPGGEAATKDVKPATAEKKKKEQEKPLISKSRFAALLLDDDDDEDDDDASHVSSELSEKASDKEDTGKDGKPVVGFGLEEDDEGDAAADNASDWAAVSKRYAPKAPADAPSSGKKGKGKKAAAGAGSGKKQRRNSASEDEVADIDDVLGFFARSDGAAAVCGGTSSDMATTPYDDEDASAPGMGGGLIINHSVHFTPEESLTSIWGILASNGLVSESLTPIREHKAELAEAIKLADEYEDYLAAYHPPPASRTTYFGIAFDQAVRGQLLSMVPADKVNLSTATLPAEAAEGGAITLKPLSAVHHTLFYTGGYPDHEAELQFGKRVFDGATAMEVRVTALAWDSRCLCAVVDKASSLSRNRHPHITMALGPSTQPVYSNEMLARYYDALEEQKAKLGAGADDAAAEAEASKASGVTVMPVSPSPLVVKGQLARDPL